MSEEPTRYCRNGKKGCVIVGRHDVCGSAGPSAESLAQAAQAVHNVSACFLSQGCHVCARVALALEKARSPLDARLREELWHNHGCSFAGKYGDDGEMQCGACRTDFKRMPLDELLARVDELRRVALGRAVEQFRGVDWSKGESFTVVGAGGVRQECTVCRGGFVEPLEGRRKVCPSCRMTRGESDRRWQ